LAKADLKAIGLTTARAKTLNALAVAVQSGRVDFANTEELRTALVSVPGIGSWTAEYVGMRGLSDPDAFPAGDLVLQRMAGKTRRLTERELLERAEQWRPWRAYAVLHLWRAASDVKPSQKLLRSA
jgi:AraC family transcriptional regulator of adaptative response / DNA-3-methyladenine glycosylase II